MLPSRRLFLFSLGAFCLALLAPPARTTQPGIGILTLATNAKLDEAAASAGLTVFEGERLSTQAEGRLSLRVGRSDVTLGEKTQVELIRMDGGGVHVDMEAGAIYFASAENEVVEVHTAEAIVRPASAQPTQASVVLLAPKTLQITAERGTLHFSYRDEQRNLPEGQTYRVYLDADDPQSAPEGGARTTGTTTKLTYFIVGAGVAAAGGGAALGIDHALRSSNPPISPSKP
jgi:hypothetical protein